MKLRGKITIGVLALLLLAVPFYAKKAQMFGFSNPVAQPYTIVSAGGTQAATSTQFVGDVSPQTNAQSNLGSPALSWNNLYASGALIGANVSSTGGISNFLNIKVTSSTNAVLVGDGTVNNAAFGSLSSPKTGIFFNSAGANDLSIGTGGSTRIDFFGSNITVTNADLVTGDGHSLGSAAGAWLNGYFTGTVSSTVLFASSSTDALQVTTSTTLNPNISQKDWPGTGIRLNGATNQIVFSGGGQQLMKCDQGDCTFNFGMVTGASINPATTASYSLGSLSKSFLNIAASGTEITFGGLAANDVTDKFACVSATGTLRTETANCTVSSIRFKEHVETLPPLDLLAEAKRLRAVQFDYTAENGGHGTLGTPHDEGFIAEEVARIDPYMVVWQEGSPEDVAKVQSLYPALKLQEKDGKALIPKTVDYMKISALEAGAIQAEDDLRIVDKKESDARFKKLEHRVGILEHFYQGLKAFVHTIRI